MDSVKSWAVSAVFAMAVSAAVSLLSLNSEAEKSMKFITSVFVVLMFLSPVSQLEFDALIDTQGIDEFIEAGELERAVEEQALDALVSQITSSIKAFCEKIEIEGAEIRVSMDIDSDKNISIKSIEISADGLDENKRIQLDEFVKENFGIQAEILS